MERTPSLPPVLRVQPDVCSPRSVVYDMPSMLANHSRQPSDFALIPGARDVAQVQISGRVGPFGQELDSRAVHHDQFNPSLSPQCAAR